jgi:hypothetical protein
MLRRTLGLEIICVFCVFDSVSMVLLAVPKKVNMQRWSAEDRILLNQINFNDTPFFLIQNFSSRLPLMRDPLLLKGVRGSCVMLFVMHFC